MGSFEPSGDATGAVPASGVAPTGIDGPPPLLAVDNLEKHFAIARRGRERGATLRAVDGVSFSVRAGECLAVVGESGSGKSTLARALMRLVEPSGGSVRFQGEDLMSLSAKQMRAARRHIQMIFQDPYASLHPRQTVAEIISEPWKVHRGLVSRKDQPARVRELLRQVGLPVTYESVYPARLSGGERQRVAIARALALQPKLLVLDEPVSALDVSIQAQVINLLMSLQQELDLAYVFISHDLSLVRLVADRVAVMYMGKFVEIAPAEDLYTKPSHPYTRALLGSSPSLVDAIDMDSDSFADTDVASPLNLPSGCRFRTRCPMAQELCEQQEPALQHRSEDWAASHLSACHFAELAQTSGGGAKPVVMTS